MAYFSMPLRARSDAGHGIQEITFGPQSVAAARVASNLGELFVRQGRYSEGEVLYRRALQDTEQALGPEHPDVADQLGNLASLFTYQGRASEAEGLLPGGDKERSFQGKATRLFATRSLYALLWDHVTALQELAQGLIVPAPQLLG